MKILRGYFEKRRSRTYFPQTRRTLTRRESKQWGGATRTRRFMGGRHGRSTGGRQYY